MTEIEIYKAELEQWGPEVQALIKSLRGNEQNKDAVAEEIADIYIMSMKTMLLYDCEKEVEEWKARKLRRLEARILEAEDAK